MRFRLLYSVLTCAVAAGVLTVVIAEPGAAMSRTPRDGPPATLTTLVETFLGGPPADCGRFPLDQVGEQGATSSEMRAAIACARGFAARHTRAWVYVELQGIDSALAFGLVVVPDGRIRMFGYDSFPPSRPGGRPRFGTRPCMSARVREDSSGRPTIRCEGD